MDYKTNAIAQAIEAELAFKICGESHRFAHTWDHVEKVYSHFKPSEYHTNRLFAIFHDSVYYPWRIDNEEKSVEFMKKVLSKYPLYKELGVIEELEKAIMATKYKFDKDIDLKNPYVFADLAAFFHEDHLDDCAESEMQMFKEFQCYSVDAYIKGRLKLLNDFRKIFRDNDCDVFDKNIKRRIAWVENFKPKIGIFAGSFNPFHVGHMNVLQKAEQVFDKVIVAVGINTEKISNDNYARFREAEDLKNIVNYRQVTTYTGLLTDFLQELRNSSPEVYENITLVRGLRNGNDLAYEQNLMDVLRDVRGNKTLGVAYFMADREYRHISSSTVRELAKFGKGNLYNP